MTQWSYYGETTPEGVEPWIVPALWRQNHHVNAETTQRLTDSGWVPDASMPDGLISWTHAQAESVIMSLIASRAISPSAHPDAPATITSNGTARTLSKSERLMWRIFWFAMLVTVIVLVTSSIT